jgi:hypothetical protein
MKYSEAKIGRKVKYSGNNVIGDCAGIITELYPPDPKDSPDDKGFALVVVDLLPHPWPYNNDAFTPSVEDLRF